MACQNCGPGGGSGAGGRPDGDGATPFQALLVSLTTPQMLRQYIITAKAAMPAFPDGGAGLLVWSLYQSAGFPLQYSPSLPQLVAQLQPRLRTIPPWMAPKPTDLFVCIDEQGLPNNVGFVAKLAEGDQAKQYFYVVDSRVEQEGDHAYRARRYRLPDVPTGAAEVPPDTVAFYLRCPTCGG